ncbi:MerR family transcriptional regulator [Enterococcus saccharolyticus]|uniref:MerR family transcriptional regulator n=1 Tax=Enterococcus saccharolyticus TaxID=41997 RepID=UPI0039E19AE1
MSATANTLTIKEVSEKYAITIDTLRYYERIGLLPKVQRNNSGYRVYSEYDENWIFYIKSMRDAGMSIETLIEYVTLFQQGIQTIPTRKELLLEQRKELAERIASMQEVLDRLDKKIDGYEQRVVKYEKNELNDDF